MNDNQPSGNGWDRAAGVRFLAVSLCILSFCLTGPAIAQGPPSSDELTYRLVNADAAAVGPQLTKMLRQHDATAEVSIDHSKNALVVRGPGDTRQLASQLIRTLDQERVSKVVPAQQQQQGTVRGYAVDAGQIDALVEALRQQFPPSTGARIGGDKRTSQVIVIAPNRVHQQIETYVRRNAGAPGAGGAGESEDSQRKASPSYQLRNITWREFERDLRALLREDRLDIQSDAGEGVSLVYNSVDSSGKPCLRIDQATNVVHFTADRESNQSWRRIAVALDHATGTEGEATQLVPLRRADPAKVREAIAAIRDAARRREPGETMATVPFSQAGRRPDSLDLASMIFRPAEEAEESSEESPAAKESDTNAKEPDTKEPADEAGEAGEAGDGERPSGRADRDTLLEQAEEAGLLGDVQVEFAPELGVIILRGNKRDVARVQEIIDQIEKESIATEPEVDVVSLEHAHNQAMAEVITQIYEDVYEPRLGSLSITPLVRPNAILFVGRQQNIDTVLKLVSELDKPVAPDTQIQVFRLLHMSAMDAEQYIQSFYGAEGGAVGQQQDQELSGLAPRFVVIGDYRSNSLIVQASPRDMREVSELLEQLDVEKTEAKIEVRVFPLQNSLASDMQTVLQDTLAGQAAGGPQQAAANQQGQQPSRSVQIVGIDQKGNQLIESGLLTDVTITADDNSNAVVVKAPSHSMGLIAALVEKLDTIPAAESEIKVFQIENGDATNLTVMLQQLFGQPVTAGQVGVFSQTVGRTFGGQQTLTQTTAGESSLVPLTFGVDARTNSIIASGSRSDLAVVEAILLRLDEGDLRQRQLMVYRLNNAPAEQVAEALTQILIEQQQLLTQQQSQQFSLISQFEYLDQQVFVQPEIISNSLIVSATPKYFEQITEVIQDLDRRPPMVMLQVVVCLVRLNDNEEMGVELGIQDSLLFDRGSVVDGLLQPGFDFVGRPLGNATAAGRGLLAGQAFGSFGVGRNSSSQGFPGLVLSASNESINLLIRSLVSNSRAQVLSRPQIMTMNNVPASVLVGQRVPQITDFQTTTSGSTVQSVDLIDTGISLGVIPRVTPDGLIIMDLEVNDSSVGDPSEGITVGVADGVPIQSPIFDDVTAITTVAARSGQTVVFGGLITGDRAETFRGIPYLSQVPVVGQLFRFDTRSNARQELIFFLTPHIVMDDEDLEILNQREAERMSWCYGDIVDNHGDPGFQWGGGDQWHRETPVIYPHLDPTAEGPDMPDGARSSPEVSDPPEMQPENGTGESPPFIVPPEEREKGKPFLVPREQRKEGEPFIVPPDQREEGKPFLDAPPDDSPRGEKPGQEMAPGSEASTGWRPPDLTKPWHQQALVPPRQLSRRNPSAPPADRTAYPGDDGSTTPRTEYPASAPAGSYPVPTMVR
ncbi:MAG: secretin N-terminal domain-containing protein [Planctomycetota bacterium]